MLGLVSSIIAILSILWIVASYSRVLYLRSRMPPGPFPHPIVGNIGQVPTEKPYVTFEKWSEDYKSPLITLWTGNRPTVIANDCWSASDLMDKRANIYSSRPASYLASDMLDDTENNQINLVYGDKWRLHRRIAHSAVGSQAVRGYRTFQSNEPKILARDILDGNDFVVAIERYACSVASIIGWGRRIRNAEDDLARLALSFLELKLSPKEIASLTGNLIGGGVDTTTTTILVFIFAMCAFPRVQQKAQEEIDRVLAGEPRPPRWEDEESLPYCRALLTEIFRWRSAIALGGPPHAPTQDDVYNGMLIPAGTTIIGNLWAIHRNPRDYPNPDEVRPERFLDEAERRPNPSKRGIFTFGWGRRVCSGQPLAEQGVWFTIVELLWAFRMRSVDEQGNDKKLDIFAFNNSPAPRPLPFNVEFTPRSGKIEEIIRQEASRAELELWKYDISSKVILDNNWAAN
ncbi:Cytochrome P450 monooxygenase yanC [Colletotrichum tropicale]|nr:Cytochrome P450 monooxygenase yanC [Colletotrichum tropicale]